MNKNASDSLRLFRNGLLKTRETKDGRPFLLTVEKPTEVCDVSSDSDICYLSGKRVFSAVKIQIFIFMPHVNRGVLGDPERANLITEAAVTETMFMRLHNIVATDLQRMHESWSDETIFQEARRIVIAFLQHITYNEYLPVILGKYMCNVCTWIITNNQL